MTRRKASPSIAPSPTYTSPWAYLSLAYPIGEIEDRLKKDEEEGVNALRKSCRQLADMVEHLKFDLDDKVGPTHTHTSPGVSPSPTHTHPPTHPHTHPPTPPSGSLPHPHFTQVDVRSVDAIVHKKYEEIVHYLKVRVVLCCGAVRCGVVWCGVRCGGVVWGGVGRCCMVYSACQEDGGQGKERRRN